MTEKYTVSLGTADSEAYVVSRCPDSNEWDITDDSKADVVSRCADASDVIDFFHWRRKSVCACWLWTPDVPRGHELDLAYNDRTKKKGDIKLMLNIDGFIQLGRLRSPGFRFDHYTCRLRTIADDEVVLYTDRRKITAGFDMTTVHSFHDRHLTDPDETIREAINQHLPIAGVGCIVSGYASQFAFTWAMFKSLLTNVFKRPTFWRISPFFIQHAETLEIRW